MNAVRKIIQDVNYHKQSTVLNENGHRDCRKSAGGKTSSNFQRDGKQISSDAGNEYRKSNSTFQMELCILVNSRYPGIHDRNSKIGAQE